MLFGGVFSTLEDESAVGGGDGVFLNIGKPNSSGRSIFWLLSFLITVVPSSG
jgi:hypothetical protein